MGNPPPGDPPGRHAGVRIGAQAVDQRISGRVGRSQTRSGARSGIDGGALLAGDRTKDAVARQNVVCQMGRCAQPWPVSMVRRNRRSRPCPRPCRDLEAAGGLTNRAARCERLAVSGCARPHSLSPQSITGVESLARNPG